MRYGYTKKGTVAAAWLAVVTLTMGHSALQTAKPARAPQRVARAQVSLMNAAEDQFLRKLTNEFSRTLGVVAANPDVAFRPGTFAGSVRGAYLQLVPAVRKAFNPGSLKLVPLTGAARPTTMVKVGTQDVAILRAQTSALPSALSSEFRTLINKRLDGFGAKFGALARSMSMGAMRLPKTSIEGSVPGESAAGWKQEITLNQPQVLGFRWNSEETGAANGYWELRQAATGLLRERVLATGTTSDDRSKPGAQGFFEIDFTKYLAPKPPATQIWTYHVRIKPLPEQSAKAQKVAPRQPIGPAPKSRVASTGGPPEPDGVGPWSAPVIIHYGASTTPPQQFTDVYRRVHFYLDSIEMIEDQQGPGAEEFHVVGFVQSNAPSGTGNQYKFGPFFAKLDPDGPRQKQFGRQASFDLPSAGDFPRAYTVVLSILEEDPVDLLDPDDAREALDAWIEALWKMARSALTEEIEAAIKERLGYLQAQMAKEVTEAAIRAALDVFKESTTNDFYTAWLNMVWTIIEGSIEGGLPHDYYGTEVISFVMPTNHVDEIRNGFAFWVVHKGSTQQLTGQAQGDGSFLVRNKVIRFYGQASYPEAGSFDGIVDLTMHWVFTNRGL